ncbi:unnamed protein product, partial [Dicrocoelium dendriticum]
MIVLGYTVPHPYLNTNFTQIVVNHLMLDVNINAKAFSIPSPYNENAIVLFDLLDLSSEIWKLSYLVVYSPRLSGPDALRVAIKSGPNRLTTSSLPLHPEFLGFRLPADAHELFASYENQHNKLY